MSLPVRLLFGRYLFVSYRSLDSLPAFYNIITSQKRTVKQNRGFFAILISKRCVRPYQEDLWTRQCPA
jgi:hypothetical protein